jgi:hypothetical protein
MCEWYQNGCQQQESSEKKKCMYQRDCYRKWNINYQMHYHRFSIQ